MRAVYRRERKVEFREDYFDTMPGAEIDKQIEVSYCPLLLLSIPTCKVLQIYHALDPPGSVSRTPCPLQQIVQHCRRSVAAQKPSYSHRLDAPTDSNFGALLLRVSHLPAQQSLLPHKRYDSSLPQWNQGPRAGSIKGMPSGDAIIVFG